MKIFLRLPPIISVSLFYATITAGMFLKILFGTAWGALGLALIAYYLSPMLFGSKPMTIGELVFWLSELSEGYKVAVLSSALTIAGFLVAFHTATINWRNQFKAELKTQSAGEVEEFFSTVSSLVSEAQIYAESLVEAVNKLQKGQDPEEAMSEVNWVIDKAQEFLSTRNQISQAQIQVHRLKGRNYTVLSAEWGLASTFDQAVEALDEIGSKMWINVPIVDKLDTEYLQQFHNLVNVDECKSFIDAADRFSDPMSMLAASIKGRLMAPVMGFSWPMYISLISNRKEFSEAIKILYKAMNHR